METFLVVLVTDCMTEFTVDKLISVVQTARSEKDVQGVQRSHSITTEDKGETEHGCILENQRSHYISVVRPKLSEETEISEAEWEPTLVVEDSSPDKNVPQCLQSLKEFLSTGDQEENKSLMDSKKLADDLHLLADKLPVTGSFLLDLVWITSGETDLPVQEHLSLFGCLRRLLEWHNANITILSGSDLTASDRYMYSWKPWIIHLSASFIMVDSEEAWKSIQLCSHPDILWKGWMTLTESWGVSSVALPGFVLTKWKDKDNGSRREKFRVVFDREESLMKRSTQPEICLIGARNMDVVKIMKVGEMPAYFISPYKYKLSLAPTQGATFNRSKKFLSWLRESKHEIGVLVRLECKVCDSDANLSGRQQSCTSSWKEAVMKNPNSIATPDVNVKGTIHNVHFLLNGISDDECTAYLLNFPDQLNGYVGYKLAWYENTLKVADSGSKTTAQELIEDLPMFDLEELQNMQDELQGVQATALHQWIEKRQQDKLGFEITHSELVNLLETARREYIRTLQSKQKWKMKETGEIQLDVNNIPSELDVSPAEWPERQALMNKESLSKKLKRINTEDMIFRGEVIKAPLQDDSVRLDVREFLKFFKSSGEPVDDDLSPVGVSNSNSSKSIGAKPSVSSITEDELKNTDFKEAKRLNYHGINYCLESRNSEQMCERLNNLQSCYITHETSSTCTLDQASSPATMAMLASSPAAVSPQQEGDSQGHKRSESLPSASSGTPSSMKRKRKTTPKKEIAAKRPVRSSPRRASIPRIAAIKKEEGHRGRGSGRRGIPLHQRSASVGSVDSRSESRSEKHKRRLRYIVDLNLKKHGISKDHEYYQQCSTRLYTLSKSFLKDLKTSHGLEQEMKNVVESNAAQVVTFEMRRAKQ
ncbi:mdm2-binding protein-like [Ptychodera flava]|uniref:mdm2-binding protein-like n=1 Tax=Ptychodera flava TaxID=63121 RepID=UPI003969F41E